MCGGPAWKREIVPDHKFDFIDTREFTDNGFAMRMKYLWVYIIVLKSFLVYVSDIFSAVTMLTTHGWSNQIFNDCPHVDGCVFIPFNVGKWLFVGCIIFSFLLLAYEARKAKKIIASRDISYAFANEMANHYYSLRSYDHFCFFDHISNSTKTSDDFAFFVFFVFKSWKRVLLADGPRQTINALTLYAIYLARKDRPGAWYDVPKYFTGNNLSTSALTVTTFFTVVVFAGSLLLLIAAGIAYVPLLCYIQGNLKEYCCHKVDKRISAVIKRRQKQRLADAAKQARKEAMGDYSHLKNKKGEMIATPLPQPTLPNLSVDDEDDSSSMNTRVAPNSAVYAKDNYYYSSDKGSDYPPMPAYNQPYLTHQAPGAYGQYNPSQATLGDDYQHQYTFDDDNESTAYLPAAAAPFAQQHIEHPTPNLYVSTVGLGGDSYLDPHGRTAPNREMAHRSPPGSGGVGPPPSSPISLGLAYDDVQDYPSHISGPPTAREQRPPHAWNAHPGYSNYPATTQDSRFVGRGRDEVGGDYGGGYSHAM